MSEKSVERRQKMIKLGRWLGSEAVQRMVEMGFCEAPASTRYHGCYDGGLFDHSEAVLNRLLEMTRKHDLKWERTRSPYIIAMMHDLCKTDQYRKIENPMPGDDRRYEHVETEVKGHGSKSAIYAKRITDLTLEEEFCILYHMGAFGDKQDQQNYSDAVKRYPNVLWTHTADMLASQVDGK